MRMLLLLVAVVLALAWWSRGRKGPAASGAPPAPPAPQPMLRCARCGLHLPAADALRDAQGRPYCGPAHLQQGPEAS